MRQIQAEKLRLVSIDWDGTSVNNTRYTYDLDRLFLLEHGIEMEPYEEFRRKPKANGAAAFFAGYGIDFDEKDLEMLDRIALELREQMKPQLHPGYEEALVYLKSRDLRLAILSAARYRGLERRAVEYGVADYFDHIIGDSKDKAHDLKQLCNGHTASAAHIDDLVVGVRAAKQAGVYPIGFGDGFDDQELLLAEEILVLPNWYAVPNGAIV